ncbi:MAG: hypothetical protein RBT11_10565 [Desulfobacterales bacterium]|jgi:hypothetical protein|nr:hypothetical protein [Desulfobacterales bacterium]
MITKNPYIVTALIFVVILFIGRRFLHWGETSSAFLLLFFFLAVIGVRLDDIVKKISATNDRLDRLLKIQNGCAFVSDRCGEPNTDAPSDDVSPVLSKEDSSP